MRSLDKNRKPTWRWPVAIIISVAIVCTTYLIIIFKAEITGRIITRTQKKEKCRRQVSYLAHQNGLMDKALKRMSKELSSKDQKIRNLERQLDFYHRFRSINAYPSVNYK